MKVTVFNGSPAGESSATNVIAEAFLRGAAKAGAEVQNIFLKDYQIKQCQGCFACWFQTPGQCVCRDDMVKLLDQYNQSDIVCFGTPVYTWNMTALLKNFADRLIPLKSPIIVEQEGNFDLADTEEKTQKFVVLSNCGFPGEKNFEVMKAAFACCNPSLEIYRNCGKLLKTKDKDILPVVKSWLQAVSQAGYEMVQKGEVSEATARALEQPLMSVPEYVAYLGM